MQSIYPLRVLSGLALRLRLSGAFLLGSAGLVVAASLLLHPAADGVGRHRAWQAATDTSGTDFSTSQDEESIARLTSLTNLGPAAPLRYSLPNNLLYRGAATDQAAYGFFAPTRVVPTPLPTPLDAVKTTMQRSWDTIKSAFR